MRLGGLLALASALADHIGHVLLLCANLQVRRVAARGVIACVHNTQPLWYRAVERGVRDSVGAHPLAANLRVAVAVFRVNEPAMFQALAVWLQVRLNAQLVNLGRVVNRGWVALWVVARHVPLRLPLDRALQTIRALSDWRGLAATTLAKHSQVYHAGSVEVA